jgi:hypothetical protein
MLVSFYRDDEARVSGWTAVRGKRTVVRGTVMALGRGYLSHDLAQYVVEAACGYDTGFWGLLQRGATFTSTGRKRTRPGRAIIAAHRAELSGSEQLAAVHLKAWQAGELTDVTRALRKASAQFSALAPGEVVEFRWPSAQGQVVSRQGSGVAAHRPG